MKLADYMKKLVRDYFVIFAIIVISNTILRQIFAPREYFELKDIFIYMLGALAGDLPSLLFYSPKEISEKGMRVRRVIHFVVLEVVLLALAHGMGWITDALNTILFAFQVAVIYVLVRFLSWMDDKKAADRINEKLKAMRDESMDGLEEK